MNAPENALTAKYETTLKVIKLLIQKIILSFRCNIAEKKLQHWWNFFFLSLWDFFCSCLMLQIVPDYSTYVGKLWIAIKLSLRLTSFFPHFFLAGMDEQIMTQRTYLVSRMKFVTGAFLGSCTWAQERLTERDVKPVIIGRPGASGMSCTNKSIGSPGLSLIVQIYSPLSISFTGLKCKLKFFGFSDLWKKGWKTKKII